MAFVADPTEEELQRALALQGASPAASSGPAGASAGAGAPSGPSVPQGAAPTVAPGAEQGTGFVNLSRYFDANTTGAGQLAQGLMDPLKVDPKAAGDAAAAGVTMPAAPKPYVDDPSNPAGVDPWTGQPNGQPTPDQIDAANRSDYEKALAQAQKDAEKARQDAIQKTGATNLETARGIVNDPLKRSEAMSVDGKNPSGFDSYLAGSAIEPAYQGLRDYYGVGGQRHDPTPPPDPLAGRGERPPGTPGPPAPRPGMAPPPGITGPGAGGTWGTAPPPMYRKRAQNEGNW